MGAADFLPKHTPGTTHIHKQRTISEVTLRVSANGTGGGERGEGMHVNFCLYEKHTQNAKLRTFGVRQG